MHGPLSVENKSLFVCWGVNFACATIVWYCCYVFHFICNNGNSHSSWTVDPSCILINKQTYSN